MGSAQASDYLENKLIDHLFRTGAFAKPAGILREVHNATVEFFDFGERQRIAVVLFRATVAVEGDARGAVHVATDVDAARGARARRQIGRASCRERVLYTV